MANTWFQFKQFTIIQKKSAMKVGTDGVLLGAWAEVRGVKKILDVGTGTGLIALMMAQRSNATIDAVESVREACREARENVLDSPWKKRIRIIHSAFQDFAHPDFSGELSYDLVISNPPYFNNSFPAKGFERQLARYTKSLSLEELISGVSGLLNKQGRFCVILPFEQTETCKTICKKNGLFCQRIMKVKPSRYKEAVRSLLEFGFVPKNLVNETLVIEENGRHQYSEAYKKLTRDFYLNF